MPSPRAILAAAAVAAVGLTVSGIAVAAGTSTPTLGQLQADAHALASEIDAYASAQQVTPSPTTTATPTTSSTPSSTPSATSASPSSTVTAGGLSWPAPTLTNPITIQYPSGAKGLTGSASLNDSQDYVVKVGTVANAAGLAITGGRNVVVDGGTIDVGAGNGTARRGGYLQVAGHLWVHDLTITSSTGSLTEGFDIANGASHGIPDTVTLQGITFAVPLVGSYATNHADVIQAWAGPRVLQVDGLTATTGYQGFFLLPTQHQTSVTPTGYDLRNVNLTGNAAGYLLWRDGLSYPIVTSNVHVCGSHIANGGLWPDASAWPGVTVC